MKFIKISFLTLALISMGSCSWISNRRSLFGDAGPDQVPKIEKKGKVSRKEYEELEAKYKALVRERRPEKTSQPRKVARPINRFEDGQIVEELSRVKERAELVETVDVFGKGGLAEKEISKKSPPIIQSSYSGALIEEQISEIRKVESLVSSNRLDQALQKIRKLENSPIRQIQVRAKFFLGEILFKQQEYDLAMQVYEEVLQKHAFSGLVLKTLGRLIACSEKLKITAKKEKYFSILHDFFEQEA